MPCYPFGVADRNFDGERFLRVVGRRRPPEPGAPPSVEARRAMTAMARYLTRAPKGIFIYRNHEEANRDRDRWVVEAIVEKQRHG
jgi:hypothetical protein